MTSENLQDAPRKRKYQHLWEHLRDNSHLILTAPRSSHKTIMQALRRESHSDRVFRFKCIEKRKAFRMRYISIGDSLNIHLEWTSQIPEDFIMGRPHTRGRR